MDNCCLCGREKPFNKCCEPYLTGEKIAPTAEALMRSRYSAFCTGHLDYLVATRHPDEWIESDRKGIANTIKTTRWLNLIIVKTEKGKPRDTRGTVEFVAAYEPSRPLLSIEPAGTVAQLHERSQFLKIDGHWLYTTGDQLPPHWPKRSAPCWCGSGKAFKQCHG